MAGFMPSNKLGIITILSVGFIFPMGCLLSNFVSSAIMATPFGRCEFTKSNVFSNSCTLLVIFLSLSSSLLCNCSCMAFCNSLNLSSSMPSSSGGSGRPLNMNSNIPISSMPILSFCPFSFAFSIPVAVLAMGSPSSVSDLPFSAFVASVPFLCDFLIWISFVAYLYGGLPFSVPSCPFSMAFLPVPNLFTSSGVFGVCNLCFSMSASIWAFSIICLFASIFFESFCPCILLAFSSTSLLASFSLYCFAVISALFLSSFGLLPWAILFISISSSSGTFCLHILILAFSFMPSLSAKCLLVCALVSILYLFLPSCSVHYYIGTCQV